LIDLHSHTHASDGTDSPAALLRLAAELGLRTLSITDHDTFLGFEEAASLHSSAPGGGHGIELIRGIELSCLSEGRTVHLLAYFLDEPPAAPFRAWVNQIVESRRDRNRALIARLQSMGVEITLAEVESAGRTVTGRPHFARVLTDKGYASSRDEAFARYIGEDGAAFVERQGPRLEDAIQEVARAGGVTSLAHPIRVGLFRNDRRERTFFGQLKDAGLTAVEAFHSDHAPWAVARYLEAARHFHLLITGGSDYHGGNKPGLALGSTTLPDEHFAALRRAAGR
jgi:predicted metal-dependent phosphoesterase TrpH